MQIKKKAFTLAEVLITLGIIGIVAALTIPTLMKSTNDIELKTAFKKTYSSIVQAYTSVVSENGNTPYDCYYIMSTVTWDSAECANLWADMRNKLKVIKTYKGAVDGVNIPNYIGDDDPNFHGTANTGCWIGRTAAKTSKEEWTFADGSMIISYFSDVNAFCGFILDVNGMKGPNKWGYDMYALNLTNYGSNKIILDDAVCPAWDVGGYRVSDILLNK